MRTLIFRTSLASLLGVAACGRTGLPPAEAILVQVVDERDTPVPFAKVELALEADGQVLAVAETSDHGVAHLPFFGDDAYHLEATANRCCYQSGAVVASVERPGSLVVIEAQTGPCPTWVPRECG